MNKTLLVLQYEILAVVQRKSFLFSVFGLPLILSVVVLGVSALKGDSSTSSGRGAGGSSQGPELKVEGYVDQSGLIKALPQDLPAGILVAYADEASAHQALKAGEIAAYYIIPADYVEKGDLIYVNPDYHIALNRGQSWVMRRAIFANLLGNDPARIARAERPMDVQVRALEPSKVQRDDDNPLTFFLPYGMMMIFFIVLVMSGGLLLDSVGKEKQNRLTEMLLLSVNPQQLLTGKIVGLGLLGLFQTLIWVGTSLTLLRLRGQTLNVPPGFELSTSTLAWGLVFFLLGYAVYASQMAGLGALAPNMREASQAVILVIWPMIIPMFLVAILSHQPHGALATALSLFPLTAPPTMMLRLVSGGVPLWQPLLAAGLLALTALFVVRAVAGMFHAQHLLSGQPFSVRRFFNALLGRMG